MHTTKQLKSLKDSFIFLETIISLIVISIIVTVFFKLHYDNSANKKFQTLNELSNKLKKSDYQNIQALPNEITILENGIEKKVLVNKITLHQNSIKLIKYELIN